MVRRQGEFQTGHQTKLFFFEENSDIKSLYRV